MTNELVMEARMHGWQVFLDLETAMRAIVRPEGHRGEAMLKEMIILATDDMVQMMQHHKNQTLAKFCEQGSRSHQALVQALPVWQIKAQIGHRQ